MKVTANFQRKIEEKMMQFATENPNARISEIEAYGLEVADEGLGVSRQNRSFIAQAAVRVGRKVANQGLEEIKAKYYGIMD